MTVTYTAEVATCRGFGCFLKLLFRWEFAKVDSINSWHFHAQKCENGKKKKSQQSQGHENVRSFGMRWSHKTTHCSFGLIDAKVWVRMVREECLRGRGGGWNWMHTPCAWFHLKIPMPRPSLVAFDLNANDTCAIVNGLWQHRLKPQSKMKTR